MVGSKFCAPDLAIQNLTTLLSHSFTGVIHKFSSACTYIFMINFLQMYHNNCIATYYTELHRRRIGLFESNSFNSQGNFFQACKPVVCKMSWWLVAWTSFTSFRFRNQTFVQRYNDKKKDTPPAWSCPGGNACGADWQRWWMSGPPCLNIAPWPTCRSSRRPRTLSWPPAANNVREGKRKERKRKS